MLFNSQQERTRPHLYVLERYVTIPDLTWFQYQDTGVLVGSLPAAFYLAATFSYLISSELWYLILWPCWRVVSAKATFTITVLVTILYLGAGKASVTCSCLLYTQEH